MLGSIPDRMPVVRRQNADQDYDYKAISSSSGEAQIRDIVSGTYAVRIIGYGHVRDFYTTLVVPDGVSNINVTNIPLLAVNSGTLSLFHPNLTIRPFVSPAANDNLMVMVNMSADYAKEWKGKILENIMLYPMDTTTSIVIAAKDTDQLEQIYEIFLSLTDEEGNPQQPADPMQFLNFIEELSKRIIFVKDVHTGQTNLIPQHSTNFKKIMVEALKDSGKWDLVKGFITETYNIQLQEGDPVLLNMIVQQRGSQPVLMTDGNGPARDGGNLLVVSSDKNVTALSDLGYNGNWHLGITVK